MEKIKRLRKIVNQYHLDGYIIPNNDEFFGEYVEPNKDKLKYISNFSGSYGFALILKIKITFLLTEDTFISQIPKWKIFYNNYNSKKITFRYNW